MNTRENAVHTLSLALFEPMINIFRRESKLLEN